MSISRQNLTAIIVTFKSENVIHNCIQSIGSDIEVLIIDNLNDKKLKEDLEKKYRNVSCILSEKNSGMGAGNNLGIKNIKSDFALILNPDVILDPNSIDNLIKESQKIDNFGLIAPMEINQDYPNYKLRDNFNNSLNGTDPFEVKSVDGYAMLLNIKRLNQINEFYYFDENIFMYLENDDLCKRIIEKNEKIYVIPKSKVKHLGGKAVNINYNDEIELSRNWHWIWSKFYFNKKHNGYIFAVINGFPTFFSSICKFFFFLMINNKKKKQVYLMRLKGFICAFLGKSSTYRPKLRD